MEKRSSFSSSTYQGEVVFVFVYHQRIQPIAALPELSSAELPAKDDETVSNIFEKIDR